MATPMYPYLYSDIKCLSGKKNFYRGLDLNWMIKEEFPKEVRVSRDLKNG